MEKDIKLFYTHTYIYIYILYRLRLLTDDYAFPSSCASCKNAEKQECFISLIY